MVTNVRKTRLYENTTKERNLNGKICVWNINLATNTNIWIPEFVGKEIERQESDFVILTEFCKTIKHENFIQRFFIDNGYDYVLSNNSMKHNNIFVAWKRDKYTVVNSETNIKTNQTTPNIVFVVLKDSKGIEFVLAGVRITTESYENRAIQWDSALEVLKSFPRVIVGGDFNCLRRGTSESRWNIFELAQKSQNRGFNLVTPKGQSIYAEIAQRRENEFAEDHFVAKGIEITDEKYDRSFMDRNTDVYLHGKNFTIYDKELKRNIWSIDVGSGIPDHAMLLGTINMDLNGYSSES